jgi:hypothetical protein
MGLRHLHPIARSHFFNEYEGGLMPANLVWSVGDEGLLLRCFHLHPLMVKTQVPFAEFKSTIDDDLALRACPDSSRDYVVTDSDELMLFEMSALSHVVGTICPKGSIEGIAAWTEYGTNSRHRELIHSCIRIHSGPLTEPMWRVKEIESREVVNTVDKLSRLPPQRLLWKYPAVFLGLLHATMLRRVENRQIPWWLLSFGWIWSVLCKMDDACYRALFVRNGSLLITHPLWLVRRVMLETIERCIGRDDRHIVVIAADPGLGWEVARSHPDAIVQSFPANAKPDQDSVRQGESATFDLVVVADLPIVALNGPIAQRIGERRFLLSLSSDRRDIDRSYSEIVYFGGLGTRFCCHVASHSHGSKVAIAVWSSLVAIVIRSPGAVPVYRDRSSGS